MIDMRALHVVRGVLAGWLERRERGGAIAYLLEENRLLRRHRGGRRIRVIDSPAESTREEAKRVTAPKNHPLR